MAYEGRCHCGDITFSVDADIPAEATSCNCSHCSAKGLLLAFHPATAFTLVSGGDMLATYTFNTHKLKHRFCPSCATAVFSEGVAPNGAEMRAINLRAVPDCAIEELTLHRHDGAAA